MTVHILDGQFDPTLLAEADEAWPADDWPGWLRYDSLLERKRTCNISVEMPLPAVKLLEKLLGFPVGERFGIKGAFPSPDLWAGGMCSMSRGDFLDPHLDADHHPQRGWRKRVSAVLYVGDWGVCWGGLLKVGDGLIRPRVGRLVLFEPGTEHSVTAVVAPEGRQRQALTASWYTETDDTYKQRPRAVFLPRANETEDRRRQREQRSRVD